MKRYKFTLTRGEHWYRENMRHEHIEFCITEYDDNKTHTVEYAESLFPNWFVIDWETLTLYDNGEWVNDERV